MLCTSLVLRHLRTLCGHVLVRLQAVTWFVGNREVSLRAARSHGLLHCFQL